MKVLSTELVVFVELDPYMLMKHMAMDNSAAQYPGPKKFKLVF